MSTFLEALRSGRVLLMDGAMGTELQRAGLPDGACCEEWNLTHPERVLAVHRNYVDAGAEVLLTNSFQANPPAFAKHGLEAQLEDLCRTSAVLARQAAGPKRFVLASMAPFAHKLVDGFGAKLLAGFEGTDGFLVETASDVIEATLLAVDLKVASGVAEPPPLLLSFAYQRVAGHTPRTFHGHTPEQVARWVADAPSVVGLGVNCGREITIDACTEIVRRYRDVTNLPLFARPNAGTPKNVDGQCIYPHSPEEMADKLPALLQAGVCMVGGCCGTTPAQIAGFRKVIDAWNQRH
jgi:5-methyltetrahydrofolate--homocysteine methyltransferase